MKVESGARGDGSNLKLHPQGIQEIVFEHKSENTEDEKIPLDDCRVNVGQRGRGIHEICH